MSLTSVVFCRSLDGSMGLAKIYPCTSFINLERVKIEIFTGSRFMKEGLKFKILALYPDYAPFGGILSRMRWDLQAAEVDS